MREHFIPAREGFEIGMRKRKEVYMSKLHQELEGRKAVLRNELRDALRLRDAGAYVKLAETEAKAERGRALLKQAEAELTALQASRYEFRERCVKDYSFTILASIESGGDIPPMESDSGVPDDRPLVAAQMRLDAFKTAAAKLDADLAAAYEEAGRSEKAVTDFDAAIFDLEVECNDVLRSRW